VDHCDRAGLNTIMTSTSIASGSDRALAAADAQGETPEIIVNLQGDAPFTPIAYIVDVVKALLDDQTVQVATPCLRLDWPALDQLRQAKQTTPFSGTTCLIGPNDRALWFSKSILPAIRGEDKLRAADHLSPIYRHVGIYGYRLEALKRFAALPPSYYEQLEGLEQLRLLENGISIKCVEVEDAAIATSGVDAPDDLERLEKLIAAHGDPDAVFFDD
ncbi:MAG: 3-deoxy-manno-octulosonate cytidylyltransferase, partial [Pseudomonadota bacterium]